MEKNFFNIAAAERGMSLPHLKAFLAYIEERLPPADFAEAKSRLHSAVCPIYAAHHASGAAKP